MQEIEQVALAAENEELLSFLYMCPVGVLRLGATGCINMLNPHAAQLLMPLTSPGAVLNFFEVFANSAPELRNLVDGFDAPSGHICENHYVFLSAPRQGTRALSVTLLKVDEGCIMALLSDVSKQVEQDNRLRQTESWFSALLSGVRDFAMFALNIQGQIESWSASAERQTGFSDAEVSGKTMHCFYHPDENRQGRAAEQVDCAKREGWHLDEGWCVRGDGTRFWAQILVAAIEDATGDVSGFSVVLRDTTERRMTSEELRRLLTTDYLTGATNRAHFGDRGSQEVSRHYRYGNSLSLIMFDVDHFKHVNDTFGHATGDQILRVLVKVCQAELRGTDILARVGGEEFAVLLPETTLEEAVELAERLRCSVERDLDHLEGVPVQVTISLGCATMTGTGVELDGLLEAADQALYRAKRLGRNRVESDYRDPAALDRNAVLALSQMEVTR